VRYSLNEVLSGMLATIESNEFPDDATALAATFEQLATQFPMFAPMAAGVDPAAIAEALQAMEDKAILKHADGRYVLSAEGRARCVSSKRTLFGPQDVEQLEQAARAFSAA
jgi:hypothetical protein